MIKVGLWSLVYTFVPKDLASRSDNNPVSMTIQHALSLTENALRGDDPNLLSKIDESVSKARTRIKEKVDQFSRARNSPTGLDST